MFPNTVTCPDCQKTLRVSKPLSAGRRLRCPACGCRFLPSAPAAELPDWPDLELEKPPQEPLPEPDDDLLPEAPDPRRSPLLVGIAGLLLVAGLGAAVVPFFSPARDAEPSAQPQESADLSAADKSAQDSARQQQEKRQAAFQRLLVEANQALAERRYEDAIKGYAAARDLLPENVEAARGLAAAREGLANQGRDQQEKEKRQAEFKRLLDEGKTALADKKFAQAVRSFEDALQLMPGEAEAIAALGDARKALAADMEEQRKLAEYKRYLAAAQAALVAKRYADAVREYSAALTVMPGDKDALDGRRLAEQRLSEQQLEAKKRDAYVRAMNHGVAAMKAGQYEEAVRGFDAAVQLYPNDKEAQNALAQAKQALSKAQTAFKNLMAQADGALRTQRFTDAHRLLREALQLFPNDPHALQTLKALERYLSDVQAAQQAYQQYMLQAAAAMQAAQYEEALRQYSQALQWIPGDPRAIQAQRDAQLRWEYDQKNRPLYLQAMRAGDGALQQARFAEAIQLYQEALRLYPQDSTALASLRKARYAYYMAQGDAKMNARRLADAAVEYARALAELPGDPLATKRLAEARGGR